MILNWIKNLSISSIIGYLFGICMSLWLDYVCISSIEALINDTPLPATLILIFFMLSIHVLLAWHIVDSYKKYIKYKDRW